MEREIGTARGDETGPGPWSGAGPAGPPEAGAPEEASGPREEPEEVSPTEVQEPPDEMQATVEVVAAERAAARQEPDADPDIDALRDVDFPVVWRGYDTHSVDAYIVAVERCVAKFEERHSPTAAVQRALDRVGEQTSAILRQAERAAEETTTSSRVQADERLQRAEREAVATEQRAIERVRGLDDDIERLWQERQRLIDATKELAEQLRGVAADAEARFPPDEAQPPASPEG